MLKSRSPTMKAIAAAKLAPVPNTFSQKEKRPTKQDGCELQKWKSNVSAAALLYRSFTHSSVSRAYINTNPRFAKYFVRKLQNTKRSRAHLATRQRRVPRSGRFCASIQKARAMLGYGMKTQNPPKAGSADFRSWKYHTLWHSQSNYIILWKTR